MNVAFFWRPAVLAAAALLAGGAAVAAPGEAAEPVDELALPTFELSITTGVSFHQRSSGVWDSDEYMGGRLTVHVPVVKRRLYVFGQASIEAASSELVFGDIGTWKTLRLEGGLAVDILRFEAGHVGLIAGAGSQVAVSHTPEPLDGIPDLYGIGVRYRARQGGHAYLGWVWDRTVGAGAHPRLALEVPSPLRAVRLYFDLIPTAELPRYQFLIGVPFR